MVLRRILGPLSMFAYFATTWGLYSYLGNGQSALAATIEGLAFGALMTIATAFTRHLKRRRTAESPDGIEADASSFVAYRQAGISNDPRPRGF
jgi:hypothetical protein